ncbi:uncharacterized protein TNCV_632151 [Trichonephila clavipes]|nr:uncharacterized protein TNCV_632151 [Trichonephila clavipes]
MLVQVHIDITPPHTPLPVFRRIGERTIPYLWPSPCTKSLAKKEMAATDVIDFLVMLTISRSEGWMNWKVSLGYIAAESLSLLSWKKIRTILDTGSQKSHVTKFIAQTLKLKCVGEETTVHGLFGGIERNEKQKKYVVTLSDVFNSYLRSRSNGSKKNMYTHPKIKGFGID